MTKNPWVRFFASDWLAGTRGMSAAETGIYITLIASMYERQEPLPEDHARLSRLCGASNSVFKRTLETLIADGKITRVDGGLSNGRVEKERVYLSEKSAVGKQNAKSRWEKSEINQGSSDATAMPLQCHGNAIPEARITSSNEEAAVETDEAAFFKLGRKLLGAKAGSTLARALKAQGGNASLALAMIHTAKTKGDPKEYVWGVIKRLEGASADVISLPERRRPYDPMSGGHKEPPQPLRIGQSRWAI